MTLLSFYTSSLHLDTAFHVTNKCIATTEVKSVGTFPMILVKLATSPLPTQTILNFEQSPLGVTALSWGEGGGERKGDSQKLSLGAKSYVTITCKGFSIVSQVLLASIVASIKTNPFSKILQYNHANTTYLQTALSHDTFCFCRIFKRIAVVLLQLHFKTQPPSQPQPPAHNTFDYHYTITSDKGITDDYKFTGKTYILVKFKTKQSFSYPKKPRVERLVGKIAQRARKHSISRVFSSNKSLIA